MSLKGELPNSKKSPDLVDLFRKENVNFQQIGYTSQSTLSSTKGLGKYTGAFGKAQKFHLLNRALIGFSYQSYTEIKNLSLDQTIDLILTPQGDYELPVNDYYGEFADNADLTSRDVPKGQVWTTSKEWTPDNNQLSQFRMTSLKSWLMRQFVHQKTSIHWKLVVMLHNLLVTSIQDGGVAKAAYQYFATLYSGAFGDYRKLILQITLDPEMLMYLNGNQNNKNNPDENYARELQELFTVGKGPNSKYTQNDVNEMARLLTGWTFNYNNAIRLDGKIVAEMGINNHDTGDKQFSEFYGNRKIKGGATPEGALRELNEAIEMIFATDECAKFICRKIYAFFVNPLIDASVETNIITPLAKVFRENNFQISAVLKVLLSSEHFYDTIFYNSLIKSPLDFMIGLGKEFDLPLLDENRVKIPYADKDLYYQYKKFAHFQSTSQNMGMKFGDPPNVAGWPAYYQAPAFDLFWINSETIIKRNQYTDSLCNFGNYVYYNNSTKKGWQIRVDNADYIAKFSNPGDVDALINELVDRLIGIPISESDKLQIWAKIMQGNPNVSYWRSAWDNFRVNPSNENRQVVQNRLAPAFGYIFQLGEAQLH
jgi:uncharacterized protein (DUF1800 family)